VKRLPVAGIETGFTTSALFGVASPSLTITAAVFGTTMVETDVEVETDGVSVVEDWKRDSVVT